MDKVQERIRKDYGGEQPVGTSFVVPTENDKHPWLLHTPTMRVLQISTGTQNLYHAMLATLAHAVQSRVEAAYRRSDLFDKRRLLMDKWARYCQQEQAEGSGKILEMKPTGEAKKK